MPVLVELEKDILEPLELIAKNKSKDVGYIIAEIVDEYFERLSDEKLLKIAKRESKKIRTGKEKTIPFDEIKKEYGL